MILRMQELEPPHTHWFSTATTGGTALLQDFHAAHGTDEDYGPIPAALIDKPGPRSDGGVHHGRGFRRSTERVSVGGDRAAGRGRRAATTRSQHADGHELELDRDL